MLFRSGGQGLITFETRVINQRDEPVLSYQDRILVKRRLSAAELKARSAGSTQANGQGDA